jgi:hypothetical protein
MQGFDRPMVLIFAMTALFSGAAARAAEPLEQPELPTATLPSPDTATIVFSADKKYETADGVPLVGEPYVCQNGEVSPVNINANPDRDQLTVTAGKEAVVTSVITWVNTGFRATCGPFVSFIPEKNTKYVVVNERIGGKGFKMLWTGMARQTCGVAVYKQTPDGFTRVDTRGPQHPQCKAPVG